MLNKFPIIAEHFILATKTNKQQTHVLEQDDLEATYACLKAWGEGAAEGSKQKRLFAFFNSGDHSGASQPHRHLQFLPVEHMRDSEATNGWDLLIDLILSNEKSPGTSEFVRGTSCRLTGLLANANNRQISSIATGPKHSIRTLRSEVRL